MTGRAFVLRPNQHYGAVSGTLRLRMRNLNWYKHKKPNGINSAAITMFDTLFDSADADAKHR